MHANHHLKPNVRDNRTVAFGARGRALLPLQVQDDRCVFASDGAVVIVIVVVGCSCRGLRRRCCCCGCCRRCCCLPVVFSLASCCSGASPGPVQTVLVSGEACEW